MQFSLSRRLSRMHRISRVGSAGGLVLMIGMLGPSRSVASNISLA